MSNPKNLTSAEQIHISLVRTIERMGFPAEFGEIIAGELKTEKQMTRMVSWLIQYRPRSMEEIADEMLAIKADFAKYKEHYMAEYYNKKYNQLLNNGLEPDFQGSADFPDFPEFSDSDQDE